MGNEWNFLLLIPSQTICIVYPFYIWRNPFWIWNTVRFEKKNVYMFIFVSACFIRIYFLYGQFWKNFQQNSSPYLLNSINANFNISPPIILLELHRIMYKMTSFIDILYFSQNYRLICNIFCRNWHMFINCGSKISTFLNTSIFIIFYIILSGKVNCKM